EPRERPYAQRGPPVAARVPDGPLGHQSRHRAALGPPEALPHAGAPGAPLRGPPRRLDERWHLVRVEQAHVLQNEPGGLPGPLPSLRRARLSAPPDRVPEGPGEGPVVPREHVLAIRSDAPGDHAVPRFATGAGPRPPPSSTRSADSRACAWHFAISLIGVIVVLHNLCLPPVARVVAGDVAAQS